MNLTINLDSQSCLIAVKVQNIRPKWMLAAEPGPALTLFAQPVPENDFRQG
jgi:hypothetical protein